MIDINRIREIEETELTSRKTCFQLDKSTLENKEVVSKIQDIIEKRIKKENEDTEMYIICELAIEYLKLKEGAE